MKEFIKDTIIGGIFFLIPLFVIIAILKKVWDFFDNFGSNIANFLGIGFLESKVGGSILAGVLVLSICFLFGLLAKWTFAGNLRNRLENYLQRVFPFYDYYRSLIEQKLESENQDPRKSVFVKTAEGLKPGILIDERKNGDKVVFIPFSPKTTDGEVLIVKSENCEFLDYDEEKLNLILLKQGKGL